MPHSPVPDGQLSHGQPQPRPWLHFGAFCACLRFTWARKGEGRIEEPQPGQAQLRMESVVALEVGLCCKTQSSLRSSEGVPPVPAFGVGSECPCPLPACLLLPPTCNKNLVFTLQERMAAWFKKYCFLRELMKQCSPGKCLGTGPALSSRAGWVPHSSCTWSWSLVSHLMTMCSPVPPQPAWAGLASGE